MIGIFLGLRPSAAALVDLAPTSLAEAFPTSRVFEWDAQTSAMWQESAGGPTPADDATEPVGYITDLSGNGRHGTQATAGNRPLVVVNSGFRMFRFDGTNDALSVTLPAVTGGTMIVAGLNGIWIESGVTNTSGAKTVGSSTWAVPGSAITAILRAVGDVIAVAYLTDTSLTAGQIASIRTIYMAKGSAGLFGYGAERVTNGDGSATAGWSATNVTASINAGQLRATSTVNTGTVGLYQAVSGLSSASFYVLTGTATRGASQSSASVRLYDAAPTFSGDLGAAASSTSNGVAVSGSICLVGPADGTAHVSCVIGAPTIVGAVADFDNVSFRQLVAA